MMQHNKIIFIALLALIPIIGVASAVDFTITRQAGDTSNALLIEQNDGTDQFWVNSSGFAFHNATQIELSIHNIQNVTNSGCAENEILKVNSSGLFDCGSDNGGAGGFLNDISLEGVEVSNDKDDINFNDTASINFSITDEADRGTVIADIIASSISFSDLGNVSPGCADGQVKEFQSSNSTWICANDDTGEGGTVTGEGILERLAIWNATTSLNSTANLTFDFSATELNVGSGEHTFNATFYDIDTNQIAGSMGCSDTQSLAYNSTSNIWECATAGGGGGSDFTDRGRCVLEVPEGTVAYPDIHTLATASAKISGFVMPDGASASTINFKCDVPDNLASTPATSIKVYIMTLGAVAGPADVRLTISTLAIADTESVDASLTAETETTVTMPTATETLDVYDQDLTSDPTAGEIMTGQLSRDPSDPSDDHTDGIMVIAIYLEIDRTAT